MTSYPPLLGREDQVLRLITAALFAVLALTACASPEQLGEREARDRADDIADQLELDLGRGVRHFGGDARDVAGGEVVGREDVEFLSASGQVNVEEPALIDVRITGHVSAYSGSIGGDSWPETTIYRCYTFTLRSYDAVRDAGTSCTKDEPTPPSTPLPTSPPSNLLGEATAAALRDVLTRLDYGPDITEALNGAMPPEASLDVETVEGAIGVGIRTPDPSRDCLLGRRLADGEVEVWTPPAILVEPGEATCDGLTAAAGGAQRPPH